MPVCKQCTRSRPIEEDEVKVDTNRGVIFKHFKPCPGTKKYNAKLKEEGKGEECESTEYFTGAKDDSVARKIAVEKLGVDEEEIDKFSVTENPAIEVADIVIKFNNYLKWVETIDDPKIKDEERSKMVNALSAWEIGDKLEKAKPKEKKEKTPKVEESAVVEETVEETEQQEEETDENSKST